jgi:chromosomal replication initiator protein
MLEMVRAILADRLPDLRDVLSASGALLVDDLHSLAGRQATQAELAVVLESLAERGAPVILVADRPRTELTGVGDELGHALRHADSVELSVPEWETHTAIFIDRARGWNVQLGASVAGALASGIAEDLRKVDIILTRSMLLRRTESEGLELEHARRALAPGALYSKKPSPDVILDVVARHFGLRVRDLRAPDRTAKRATARQAAAYLLRTRSGLSLTEIGRRIGRHHSTALYSVNRSIERLEGDASWSSLLSLVEKEIILRTEKRK